MPSHCQTIWDEYKELDLAWERCHKALDDSSRVGDEAIYDILRQDRDNVVKNDVIAQLKSRSINVGLYHR